MEPTTGPDEFVSAADAAAVAETLIDMSRNVTAADILDKPKRVRRPYNTGPSSTSRKKRTQAGARGLPRKRADRAAWQDVATRVKKHKAKRAARKAIGARGVKTNRRRPSLRTQPIVVGPFGSAMAVTA